MSGAPGRPAPTAPEGAPDWHAVLRGAVRVLAAAGVDAPRADAETLLAHVLGAERGVVMARVLAGAAGTAQQREHFAALLARRAAREPLQHVTGTAHFHGVELAVGPGVFVPRPETELLVEAGLAELDRRPAGPMRVVDLCTGSGAVAAAVAAGAAARGRAVEVTAVELDDVALGWARRNLSPHGVDLRQGDALVASVTGDLDGRVDAVLTNPPYVPDAELPVQAEARADPPLALYGGDARGLRIPLGLIARSAGLLRPGGLLAMEHHETQGAELVAAAGATGLFEDAVVHRDHAGRDRVLTARRTDRPAPSAPDGAFGVRVEQWAP